MSQVAHLPSEDREFFDLVSRAAFANPFGDERRELDRRIAGVVGSVPRPELLARMHARVREGIARLEARGEADVRRFSAEEQECLKSCFLFDIFHTHLDDLDRLIREQIEAGDNPIPAPFAARALAALSERGLTKDEARRAFAILFQLRRAYFFIRHALVGRSESMKRLRRLLWDNVFTYDIRWYDRSLWNRMEDFSTLVLGETGTGKGTAGAAIGRSGFIPFDPSQQRFTESFTRAFVSLNLAEAPESLIEAELFGHRKGAFTGAVEQHEGVLSRCSPHGAIFLDEIGELSPHVQTKLLRVLQERTFSPLGSHEVRRFHGRIIAATNRAMEELRQSGRLRDDLYYRLCSDQVEMPTLRQRLREAPEELDDLVRHILDRLCGQRGGELFTPVMEALTPQIRGGYEWPGNVRELEQAVRRILLKGSYDGQRVVAPPGRRERLMRDIANGDVTAQELVAAYCRLLYDGHGSYSEVARRAGLDWRTVKKLVERAAPEDGDAPARLHP